MSLRNTDKFLKWNEQYKLYEPVMWRRDVLPSWLAFELTDTTLPFTIAAAGTATRPISYKQPYTSANGQDQGLGTPFEVRALVCQDSTAGYAAADWTVVLREMGEARLFMNRPIHVRCLFGTGQLPALLREPYMFLSQHNIQFQAAKVAGGAVNIRAYLCGAQYYPWSPNFIRDKRGGQEITGLLRKWLNRRQYVTPFWMTTDTDAILAADETADFFAKNGDDAQFEIFGHTAVSTGAFAYRISEVKTKQTLSNGFSTNVNGAGDARLPTIYPTPYLLPAGYRLRLELQDLSAAPNTVFFCFYGRRIWAPFSKREEVLADTAVPTPADSATPFVPAPL
jgi:hypothetical protein